MPSPPTTEADLVAALDAAMFVAMQAEQRVIVTNSIRDVMPLAQEALQTRSPFVGIVLTSDRPLPRSKGTIGAFVRLLDALPSEHPEGALSGRIHWLGSLSRSGDDAE